jgi:glycosyltransferase involved in cell wall biosynthesis
VSEQQLADWLTNNPQLLFHDHQTNVIPFINQADVVVLPSYREGIPRVLLEAMAMKKPFITAQSAGCKDVTSEGFNGFLVPVADAEALYHAMKKMMLMPLSDRITMGENGYQRVLEKYDEKIIVQEYLKLILPLT